MEGTRVHFPIELAKAIKLHSPRKYEAELEIAAILVETPVRRLSNQPGTLSSLLST